MYVSGVMRSIRGYPPTNNGSKLHYSLPSGAGGPIYCKIYRNLNISIYFMAFRKRAFKRKRGGRTTRRTGVSRRKPTVKRLIRQHHYFKRTCNVPRVNCNVGASGGGTVANADDSWVLSCSASNNVTYYSISTQFTLNMLQSYTEFSQMFDMYRIRKIDFAIIPYSTTTNLQTGSVNGFHNQQLSVIMHTAIDYDDYVSLVPGPAGIDALRQKLSYNTRNMFNSTGKAYRRSFVPHIAYDVYGGTTVQSFGSSANKVAPFLDCDSVDVQHYGTKWIMEVFNPDPSNPTYIWFKYEATLYLELKQPN